MFNPVLTLNLFSFNKLENQKSKNYETKSIIPKLHS